MVIRKLAISNLLVHRSRTLLTACAIALSVSLVVAVTSGYASVEAMAYRFVSRYMGTADAVITRKGQSPAEFTEAAVDQLRIDPDVKRVTGRLELDNETTDGKKQHLIGLRRPIDNRVENLECKTGGWFDTPTGDVAVIDQVAADLYKVNVGGTFILSGVYGQLTLKVTGIVQKPAILASHIQSIYLPLETLQKWVNPGKPPLVNHVMVDLKPAVDEPAFIARWTDRLKQIDPALTMRTGRDVRQMVDGNLQAVHLLSYLGGSVSMLAATFIIFSALSMGVTERSRTLAMMRAIGAQRGQVALLVVTEGLLLSAFAVAVGTPLGWLWLYFLKLKFSSLLPMGFTISWGGVLFAGVGSLLAALLASLLPAWWATRVRPLEAMAPSAEPPSTRAPFFAAFFGLLLITFDPVVLFTHWAGVLKHVTSNPIPAGKQLTIFLHFTIGLPSMMLGFFLLAPVFVVFLERLAGPPLAAMLQMRFALLRQQLSGSVWRAAGTCAALMVGLSILIAMETQGNSMLKAWELPDKFPDVFIISWNTGWKDKEIAELAKTPGIVPGDLMPIAVAAPESPTLGGLMSHSGMGAITVAAITPTATLFLGVPPEQAMRMMKLTYTRGNQADALAKLQQGGYVIVTDEYYQMTKDGRNGGDVVELDTDKGTQKFKIAAVVSSPGMDLINAKFDMGQQFDQRTVGSIFGSLSDAREYFNADEVHLFAANMEPGANEKVRLAMEKRGMNVGDVRQIKETMESNFRELLLLVAIVPFAAMAVASLGVTNTIMASIRTRRWQLGVLRSIGLTQSQLMRLIFGEAFLVGVVASGLGMAAGGVMMVDAHQLSFTMSGYNPPISIAWNYVVLGVSIVMGVSVLAAAWPAISVAKSEPLSLLQGGRSTS